MIDTRIARLERERLEAIACAANQRCEEYYALPLGHVLSVIPHEYGAKIRDTLAELALREMESTRRFT